MRETLACAEARSKARKTAVCNGGCDRATEERKEGGGDVQCPASYRGLDKVIRR